MHGTVVCLEHALEKEGARSECGWIRIAFNGSYRGPMRLQFLYLTPTTWGIWYDFVIFLSTKRDWAEFWKVTKACSSLAKEEFRFRKKGNYCRKSSCLYFLFCLCSVSKTCFSFLLLHNLLRAMVRDLNQSSYSHHCFPPGQPNAFDKCPMVLENSWEPFGRSTAHLDFTSWGSCSPV